MYFGPAYKQKYKYVPRIVNSGPGDPDSSHGFVRGSTNKSKFINKFNKFSYVFVNLFVLLMHF